MIIGLVGLAGSGKTTIAKHLESRHGFRRLSFANPLKEMVQELYGLTDSQVFGEDKDRPLPQYDNRTARELLQYIGTDVCRKFLGEDVWARALFEEVSRAPNEDYVVDDCRFLNEAQLILEHGGSLVRVVCTNFDTPQSDHPSEVEQADILVNYVVSCEVGGPLIDRFEATCRPLLPVVSTESETDALLRRNEFLESQNEELQRRLMAYAK